MVALRRAVGWGARGEHRGWTHSLAAETVQCTTLAFQRVDNVHGGDCLPLGVLGVGDGVTDNVLQENFEHTTGLLVDETGDTLDSASASQTADSGLGDTLDVVSQYLTVTLCSSLSEPLTSFATSGHVEFTVGDE
jgi:hypothetical protein